MIQLILTQVVETSVNANNNSPIQDYVHPDDQTQPTYNVLTVVSLLQSKGKFIHNSHVDFILCSFQKTWGHFRWTSLRRVNHDLGKNRCLIHDLIAWPWEYSRFSPFFAAKNVSHERHACKTSLEARREKGRLYSKANREFTSLRKHPGFSSLFAAGDVSRGGTSATQPQKFHTDDANQCLHNKSSSHGVANTNLSNFTCLLVDFGKVLCSSANELQQNSNPSSREDYIPQILTVLLEILCVYIWSLWPFVFCLSFLNNSWNNVTTPSTNQRFWPDFGRILRHQYGISVAQSQTFLRAKRPHRRRARRNGCFRRLHVYRKRQRSDSAWEFLKIQIEQIKTAQKILSKGETWSRGTNSSLTFDVNVILNLSNELPFKLIANWWAWELVPKRLAGRPTVKNTAKEVTRQPWKREPPLPAAANWHRHTERILSGKNTYPSGILTCAPTRDSREGGEGARIRKDSPAQSKRWSATICENSLQNNAKG